MKNLVIFVVGLLISGTASANSLELFKVVASSKTVSDTLKQFASDEDVFASVKSMEVTGVMRCPGCFEVTLTIHGSPKNGREILRVAKMVVMTEAERPGFTPVVTHASIVD